MIAVMALGLGLALTGPFLRMVDQDGASPSCTSDLPDQGYLDFPTFKGLMTLAPELSEVSFAGLAEAGYRLWETGQMRVPAAGNFLSEDLNGDGVADCAILLGGLEGGRPGSYILVAGRTRRGWARQWFQRLDGPGALRWDAHRGAIEVDLGKRTRVASPATIRFEGGQVTGRIYGYVIDLRHPAYVRWDPENRTFAYDSPAAAPFRPWNMKASLRSYRREYATEDFGGVHISVSPIGPATASRPGLFLVPPGYAPNGELFRPFRRPGIIYGNDGGLDLRSLPLRPRHMQQVVLAVHDLRGLEGILRRTGREPLAFSVAILDALGDRGPNFAEVLLTLKEIRSIFSGVTRIIGKEEGPIAARIIEEYVKGSGP